MFESYEDERLMALYFEGDQDAFLELYKRYKAKVFGFLNKKVDPRIAEELFQTTFLKLHNSRAMYDPQKPFSVWLFAICRNVLNDHFRQMGRKVLTEEGDVDGIATESRQDPTGRELALESAVTALPENQRNAIRMRYSEGLEFEEIAERLSTSGSNVRQLISRSVRSLKKKMGA